MYEIGRKVVVLVDDPALGWEREDVGVIIDVPGTAKNPTPWYDVARVTGNAIDPILLLETEFRALDPEL